MQKRQARGVLALVCVTIRLSYASKTPFPLIEPQHFLESTASGRQGLCETGHAGVRRAAGQHAGWLLDFLHGQTRHHEAGQPQPWSVTDAPPAYLDGMLKAIVGIEIDIARIEGKWKG